MQTNLNHCQNAQNVVCEFMRKEDIAVTLVEEPYDVSDVDLSVPTRQVESPSVSSIMDSHSVT